MASVLAIPLVKTSCYCSHNDKISLVDWVHYFWCLLCCSIAPLRSEDLQCEYVHVVKTDAVKLLAEPVMIRATPSDNCKSRHSSILVSNLLYLKQKETVKSLFNCLVWKPYKTYKHTISRLQNVLMLRHAVHTDITAI